jgi:hypothetical protein
VPEGMEREEGGCELGEGVGVGACLPSPSPSAAGSLPSACEVASAGTESGACDSDGGGTVPVKQTVAVSNMSTS